MSWKQVYNSRTYRALFLIAIGVGIFAISCKSQTEAPTTEPAAPAENETKEAPKEAVAPPQPEAPKPEEATAQAAAEPIILKDAGFATPESVLYDENNDLYLVSNINGSPVEKDNNGFISKVSTDGKVLDLKWIEGGQKEVALNAPKGMAIRGDVLYVADINTVRMFNNNTGAPMGEIGVKGATFLNDLAAGPTGTIYLSDSGLKASDNGLTATGKGAVYTIDAENKVKKLIGGKDLNQPNGLSADEGGVFVVTMGGNELYRVTDDGKKEPSTVVPSGGLDGLVRTKDGNLLVSSWDASSVFSGTSGGQFAALLAGIKSPADIGYDAKRNRLLVPVFEENAVQIRQLPAETATASKTGAPPEPEPAATNAEPGAAQPAAVAADAKGASGAEPAAKTPQKGLRPDAPEPEVAADKADENPAPAAAADKPASKETPKK